MASLKLLRDVEFPRVVEVEDSSWITRIYWNPESLILVLETESGNKYGYTAVPRALAAGLIIAESVGAFWNQNFRTNDRLGRLEVN